MTNCVPTPAIPQPPLTVEEIAPISKEVAFVGKRIKTSKAKVTWSFNVTRTDAEDRHFKVELLASKKSGKRRVSVNDHLMKEVDVNSKSLRFSTGGILLEPIVGKLSKKKEDDQIEYDLLVGGHSLSALYLELKRQQGEMEKASAACTTASEQLATETPAEHQHNCRSSYPEIGGDNVPTDEYTDPFSPDTVMASFPSQSFSTFDTNATSTFTDMDSDSDTTEDESAQSLDFLSGDMDSVTSFNSTFNDPFSSVLSTLSPVLEPTHGSFTGSPMTLVSTAGSRCPSSITTSPPQNPFDAPNPAIVNPFDAPVVDELVKLRAENEALKLKAENEALKAKMQQQQYQIQQQQPQQYNYQQQVSHSQDRWSMECHRASYVQQQQQQFQQQQQLQHQQYGVPSDFYLQQQEQLRKQQQQVASGHVSVQQLSSLVENQTFDSAVMLALNAAPRRSASTFSNAP